MERPEMVVRASKVGRRDNATDSTLMKKHLGKRERVARKRKRRGRTTSMDSTGVVSLKLGRKKFMEAFLSYSSVQLKQKFRGCVVDAER